MAAPVLANRRCVFVSKIGTNDAGTNIVGAPQPRLTITAAITDLLTNYQALTSAQPGVIAVGPGTYIEAGLILPPNVFITGSADAESSTATIIQLVGGDLEMDPDWSDGAAVGGLANITIRREAAEVIDFTVPIPSGGNPARVVSLENVTTDVPLTWEATSTADKVVCNRFEFDGVAPSTVEFSGGAIVLHTCTCGAATTVSDTAAIAAAIRLTANYFIALTLQELGGGTVVNADGVSLPPIAALTISGAITLNRLTDANGVGYTPTDAAAWPVGTDTVQEALDAVAGGTVVGSNIAAYGTGTAYVITNTAAAVVCGTTSPAIVLNKAGTYAIFALANLAYNGATVVAETLTVKVRRTNNTPADLSPVVVLDLPVATTLTYTYGIFAIPLFLYTTAVTDDAVTIFANVSATLGAGAINATAIGTSIVAIRL